MPYYDITTEKKKHYRITTPGVHVFSFANKSGELFFTIKHPRAHVYLFGTYDHNAAKHHTLTTVQKHTVASAQSHVLIKGVFGTHARFDYRGSIILTKNAHHAHATLENHNLLLDNTARVTTEPILEITPHNVTCTHAATIAPLQKEHLAILMSRGIDHKSAQRVLTQGFLDDVAHHRERLLT